MYVASPITLSLSPSQPSIWLERKVKKKKNHHHQMGSGVSRTGSSSYSRAGPRRRNIRGSISSVLICGASSSSSTTHMEDYPAELLVTSAEHCCSKKLKAPRRNSDLPVGNADGLISINSESVVSSKRFLGANENPTPEVGANHDEPSDRGKRLSESTEVVPSNQCIDSSRCNGIASCSNGGLPSCFLVSENEISGIDCTKCVHCNMKADTSQNGQGFNKSSSVYCNALANPLLDEVSVENNVSDEVDSSSSDFGSFVSDSLLDFHDIAQEVTHPDFGFLVSEREENLQDESLLHVDMVSMPNTCPANSAQIRSHETRRNNRRLLRDAFLRRTSRRSRRQADSRMTLFSPVGSDRRSPDIQYLDSSSAFIDDEFRGDLSSHGSITPGSNDQQFNSRSEIWERLRGTIDSTYYPPPACPLGLHAEGSCLCQSVLSAEESDQRTGVSRIVMLAEALFEVLDRIHQQPTSLSLSVVSLPAPESVVDSFPVKTHGKSEKSKSTDDVSQCYICLAEYEEGDRIRVLPCHHEYHLSCIDKWLKEIHGVCPLCRGDVHLGS